MTHALMIPAMHVSTSMKIVGVDVDDTKTAPGITIGRGHTAIMTGPHVTTKEGMVMVANHATMIVAMMIGDTKLRSGKVGMLVVLRSIGRFCSVKSQLPRNTAPWYFARNNVLYEMSRTKSVTVHGISYLWDLCLSWELQPWLYS